MNISPLIEVAVGLVLVYYILSLVVSFITARIMETLEQRGKDLEASLKKILGDTQLGELLKLPQIDTLKPIRFKGRLGLGFLTGSVEPKKLDRIPVANLVDAVMQVYRVTDPNGAADQLKATLQTLPDSEVKQNLLAWLDQQVTDIDQLRAKATLWFGGVMEQAAATYKAHARLTVIILSFCVTLAFGVDTLDFGNRLWHDADLRAITSAKAASYVAAEGADADIGPLIKDLSDLSFQIGWWAQPVSRAGATGAMSLQDWTLKFFGLLITFIAVAQGSSFWYDILRRLKGATGTPAENSSRGAEASAGK